MINTILSTWGFYEGAPVVFKFMMAVAAIALAFFFAISALYTPVVKNNKVKRDLMERDKEAMRLKIANDKASDKYLEYQKENEKLLSKKISMLEEISNLEETKKSLIDEIEAAKEPETEQQTNESDKNKGGRPKGSKNKPKKVY
jgi:hypothetical protein